MNKVRGDLELAFCGKKYKIKPTMDLLCELEDAVGGLVPFAVSLHANNFKTGDLVNFLVILFGQAGKSRDEVFEGIMNDGQSDYLVSAIEFLTYSMSGRLEKAPTQSEPKSVWERWAGRQINFGMRRLGMIA
ncbi:MAG: hypothetical protein JRL30_28450 [Deltaproteobacteria bacterium]|nr:hypothetical protein [Deltaproteobacteria bacterium]